MLVWIPHLGRTYQAQMATYLRAGIATFALVEGVVGTVPSMLICIRIGNWLPKQTEKHANDSGCGTRLIGL